MQTQTTPPAATPSSNRQWINANPLAIDHPNDRRFLIEQKKALVIWGEQGSGKTTFAENVAKADGTFATFEWERFQNGSTCGFLLNGIKDEATFIIENVPRKAWGEIKHLVTQKTLTINVQMKPSYEIPMPRLIFICNEKPPIAIDSHIFKVIEIRKLKPVPYWYESIINLILQLRNTTNGQLVNTYYERNAGYIFCLLQTRIIDSEGFHALSNLNIDSCYYANISSINTDNPYQHGTPDFLEWERGYQSASELPF